jgi:4-hydroxy-3-polyprenylbenzoate decarboxylase
MPNIVDIGMPSAAGSLYFMIISIKKTKPHEAKKLIKMMWEAGGQNNYVTNIIVVDADVDVHNLQKVFWAMSVHFRPEYDVMVSEVGVADPEKPSTFPRGLGAKMGIDATTKMDEEGLKRKMPDLVKMDPEVIAKVDQHWVSDGLK